MKNFIKGRWFPLAVALSILALAVVVGFLFGFRITYAPELENSWETVSAVASIIGSIGTIAAVWFAVLSSNMQNRLSQNQQEQNTGVSLYEKRVALLKKFYNGKYEDILIESQILFDEKIYSDIYKLFELNEKENIYSDFKEFYEERFKLVHPRKYKKFKKLYQQYWNSDCSPEIQEKIYILCDTFKLSFGEGFCIGRDATESVRDLDYRYLDTKYYETFHARILLHEQILGELEKEIKKV